MFVHFARKDAWEAAQEPGSYQPAEFEEDGFIPCATPEQATDVANKKFSGEDDLVLLWIVPSKLKASIIYERPAGLEVGDLYPHVYAPINVDAVVRADEIPRFEPGTFALPLQPAA